MVVVMDTPICDFVREYSQSRSVRLHMPGHKGKPRLGFECLDITEIDGADILYCADGIIRRSEKNAALLFGTQATLYSCEGSSLAIRATVYLIKQYAASQEKPCRILAARNAHKSFVTSCAILNVEADWLYPKNNELLSCILDLVELEEKLKSERPAAVYLTSPDYIGSIQDVQGIASLCRKYGSILAVDNAHGSYLKFLDNSVHPIDMGADICCDSAHKTLPALTGAAYLHISKNAPPMFSEQAENAMSLFASTSPSYLVLQSLDMINKLICDGLSVSIKRVIGYVQDLKDALMQKGFELCGSEPLKLAISSKSYGYTGHEIYAYLRSKSIICEFSDPDFCVMMFSSETSSSDINRLKEALLLLERRDPVVIEPVRLPVSESALPPSRAIMLPVIKTKICDAEGKILASPTVACPPAVPIAVCGDRISRESIDCFEYYGIDDCLTIDESFL